MDHEAIHLRSRRTPYPPAPPRTPQGVSTTYSRLELATGNRVLATETPTPTRPLHPPSTLARRVSRLPPDPPRPRRPHPANAGRRGAASRHRRHPSRLRTRRAARRAIHPLLERCPPLRSGPLVPLQPERDAPADSALSLHAATNSGVAVRGHSSLHPPRRPPRPAPQPPARPSAQRGQPLRPVIPQLRARSHPDSSLRHQAGMAPRFRRRLLR